MNVTNSTVRNDEKRFGFGRNWSNFVPLVDEYRIRRAEESLVEMLGTARLEDRSFLDAGSGSGLFSLAARRLGARVHSFDYDSDSVAATRRLREQYCAEDRLWTVEQGSFLDQSYLRSLGSFDVIYCWGVLHHTGAMMTALESVAGLVGPGGLLWVAIYNDQGKTSRRWHAVKKLYNSLPRGFRGALVMAAFLRLWGPTLVKDLVAGRPGFTWKTYSKQRGMSPWTDVVDWVGGFPFEVARPEQIFQFLHDRGFELRRLRTCGGGLGCNEFVFEKTQVEARPA